MSVEIEERAASEAGDAVGLHRDYRNRNKFTLGSGGRLARFSGRLSRHRWPHRN
jgi:hypothetical protein